MYVAEYQIDGGSPGPGVMVIVADSIDKIEFMAKSKLKEINEQRRERGYRNAVTLGAMPLVRVEREQSYIAYYDEGER